MALNFLLVFFFSRDVTVLHSCVWFSLFSPRSLLPSKVRERFHRSTGGTRELAAVAHHLGCSNRSDTSDGGFFLDGGGDIEKAFTAWAEHATVRREIVGFEHYLDSLWLTF